MIKTPEVKKLPQQNSEEQLIHITLSVNQALDLCYLIGTSDNTDCDDLLGKLGAVVYD